MDGKISKEATAEISGTSDELQKTTKLQDLRKYFKGDFGEKTPCKTLEALAECLIDALERIEKLEAQLELAKSKAVKVIEFAKSWGLDLE